MCHSIASIGIYDSVKVDKLGVLAIEERSREIYGTVTARIEG